MHIYIYILLFMFMLNKSIESFTVRDSGSETYRKIGAHILKKTKILLIIISEKTENFVGKSKVWWFY